jgi:hypothetical protein
MPLSVLWHFCSVPTGDKAMRVDVFPFVVLLLLHKSYFSSFLVVLLSAIQRSLDLFCFHQGVSICVDDSTVLLIMPLNFQEDRLSMVIILPHFNVKLLDVYKKFTEVELKVLFEDLTNAAEEFADDSVDVYLPRFSISSDIIMNKIINNVSHS